MSHCNEICGRFGRGVFRTLIQNFTLSPSVSPGSYRPGCIYIGLASVCIRVSVRQTAFDCDLSGSSSQQQQQQTERFTGATTTGDYLSALSLLTEET